MRNMFMEGTLQAGVGVAVPAIGGFRPFRMGQTPGAGFGDLSTFIPQGGQQVTIPENKVKPDQTRMPGVLSPSKDRFQWAVSRLCSIMRKFTEAEVAPDVQGQVFWSYVKHAQSSEESVITAYKTLCPDLPVPAKPLVPEKELVAESQEKTGFHGKTRINYEEAQQLLLALDEVLKPLTPEEQASEIGKRECLRDFAAGNFPKVERLKADLEAFVAAGDKTATFEISKGDIVVAGKAIDCAVALGRGKVVRAALTAGGVVGAGALLLFLL